MYPSVHNNIVYNSQNLNVWEVDKEDVVYIYTMEYFSAIRKNEITVFEATYMNLEIISEVRQKEKDKYHMISLICGI